MRAALALLIALAGCSGRIGGTSRCRPDADRLAAVDRERADGWLFQALSAAEAEQRRCRSGEADLAVAASLAELGLDRRAIDAYRAAATHGGDAAATAGAAIAALDKRAPPARPPTDEEAARVRLLYRDGVNLRLTGRPEEALRQLRKAYALAPHPLTLVQIGLAHRAAGREVDYRKAGARALALAEDSRGERARPRLRGGHAGEVTAIAFHPRGHLLASAGADGTARVWELATGRELHMLPHTGGSITGLAFSGDSLLTLVDAAAELHVWDPDTGARLRTLKLDGAPSRLATAGDLVAVGGYSVALFQLSTGRKQRDIPVSTLHSMALSPDGKLLATYALLASEIELHDVATGTALARIPLGSESSAELSFSPDGRALAIGGGATLTLWDVAGKRVSSRLALPSAVNAIAFDPASDRIAVGGAGWAELRSLRGGPPVPLAGIDQADALAFAADGSRIAGAGRLVLADQVVMPVWPAEGGAPVRTLAAPGLAVTGLWFREPGELVAAGVAGGRARVWRSTGGSRAEVRAGELFPALALDPGRLRLAAGDDEFSAVLWEPRTAKVLRSFVLADLPPRELAASRDGSLIGIVTGGRKAIVIDADDKVRFNVPVGSGATMALTSNGQSVLTMDEAGQTAWDLGDTQLWSLRLPGARVDVAGDLALIALRERTEVVTVNDGKVVRTLPAAPAVLSADGAVLARAAGGAVVIEDARTGKRRGRVAGAERTAALALAGERLAILDGNDHWYRLWDWRRGKLVQAWQGRAETVGSMTLSPDATRLVTRSDTIRLWNCDSGAELVAAPRTFSIRGELSPDGKLLAIADPSSLVIHDAGSGVVVRSLPGNLPIAWTGDGRLVSGRVRAVARVADLVHDRSEVVGVGKHRVRTLAFVAGDRLAALSGDRDLGLWDLAGGRPLWTWGGGSRIDHLLVPDAGGRWFGVAERRLLAIDAGKGDALGNLDLGGTITGAAVRADGGLLAVATRRGPGAPEPIRLLGPDLKERGVLTVDREVRLLRFAPDGKRLAGGGSDQVYLWDPPGGARRTLVGHHGRLGAIAFRADGALLATAADDRTIRLWRLPGGEPVGVIAGALDGPTAIVAPDGRVDGTEGDDGAVSLLSWQVGDVVLPGFVGWARQQSPGLLAELLNRGW